MKKAKKKGMHPAVAVGFLVLAGGFAAKTMLGGGAGQPAVGATGGTMAPASDAADAPAEPPSGDSIHWRDLLAVHGSYDKKVPVRVAFSTLAELTHAAPVPIGETQPVAGARWTGADPPAIHVGVVMISAASRRAVIDGRVVGIGDPIGDARVGSIERDVVILKMGERALTYDFDNEYPREFRSEQTLREQERARQAAEAAAAAANPEPAKADETMQVVDKAVEAIGGGHKADTKSAGKSAAKKPLEEGK